MRLFCTVCLALIIGNSFANTAAKAQETAVDEALHCAALAQLTVNMLGPTGELTAEDREAVALSIELMLAHSPLPEAKRKRALKLHLRDLRAQHSDAEIAEDIDQRSDACVEKYVN